MPFVKWWRKQAAGTIMNQQSLDEAFINKHKLMSSEGSFNFAGGKIAVVCVEEPFRYSVIVTDLTSKD